MKIGNLVLGIVLLLIGIFYAFMPHTVHISSGLDFGLTHTIHITIGIIALVIGAIVLFIGKK